MKKVLALFFAVLSFSQLMAVPDINWSSPPVSISSSGVNASNPQVAMDPSGNAVAVWLEGSVVKAATQPVGSSWSAIATVSGSGASNAAVGVDNSGNAVALWIQGSVVMSSNLPFGGSWSTAVSVSGSGASNLSIAVDGSGNAVAVWTRSSFIESSTQPFGSGWSLVSLLSATGSDVAQVAISASGKVVAIWSTLASGVNSLFFSTTPTVGGTWTTAKSVIAVSPAFNNNYPSLAIDANGNATAIWYRYASSSTFANLNVLTADLPAAATNWSAIPTILSAEIGLRDPAQLFSKVVFDSTGNATAMWGQSFDGTTFNIETALRPLSGTWSQVVSLVLENIYGFQGDLSISSSGDALGTFMFFNGSSVLIQATETVASGLFTQPEWTTPLTLSQGSDNAYPSCANAITGAGDTINAVAVWVGFDGTNNVIQSVSGSRTMISAPSALSVVQSSNNFNVFTEYYNTISWTASTDPDVVLYAVYRNGSFFNTTDAATFSIVDHNAVQNGSVTYGVAAIDNQNSQSQIVNVNFP